MQLKLNIKISNLLKINLSIYYILKQQQIMMTSNTCNTIRNKPFIVICGCTGTGKTKLSIELAQWLINSNRKVEIINADAMQV
jgi:signal recognition particle GTPase